MEDSLQEERTPAVMKRLTYNQGGFAAGGRDSCQVTQRLTAREDSPREERTSAR